LQFIIYRCGIKVGQMRVKWMGLVYQEANMPDRFHPTAHSTLLRQK
jgi:hypothetical protein